LKEAQYLTLVFHSKWPNFWTKEWFYVKNDLVKREDIKGIIQMPIKPTFGIKRLVCYMNNEA
jgi:hypothetical protein